MPSKKNYSIKVFQSPKDRTDVKVSLLEDGKTMKSPVNDKFAWKIVGNDKGVAKILFQLIQYARFHEVDFRKAWEAEEPWFE